MELSNVRMPTYEDEMELVRHAIGSCMHFTWFDNANAGVCNVGGGCYLVSPDVDEDVEHCMECGGFYEQ